MKTLERPPRKELIPNPATCTQPLGAAACLQCIAAPNCPILKLKRTSEQQTPAPRKTSYKRELLADSDGFVIAGYEDRRPMHTQTQHHRPMPKPKPKPAAHKEVLPITPKRAKLEHSLVAQLLAATATLALQSITRRRKG